jgi:hypothetical protein
MFTSRRWPTLREYCYGLSHRRRNTKFHSEASVLDRANWPSRMRVDPGKKPQMQGQRFLSTENAVSEKRANPPETRGRKVTGLRGLKPYDSGTAKGAGAMASFFGWCSSPTRLRTSARIVRDVRFSLLQEPSDRLRGPVFHHF